MTETNEPKPAAKRPRKMAREPRPAEAAEDYVLIEAHKPKTKAAQVELMLERGDGATLDELCEATGWQTHTCRAFLTGQRKKGREIIRSKREDDKTYYRVAAPLAFD
jgi:transcription initiation factor IIE alpha subunit